MSLTDAQLLVRTRRGDDAAARELWRRHAPGLTAYARTFRRGQLGADELVQAAFCRVLEVDAATLKRVEHAGAWLAAVLRREALMAMRGARRERARRDVAVARDAPSSSVALRDSRGAASDPVVVSSAHRDEIRCAVESLPRRAREVVLLKHVCGLTFEQMALALGANRDTLASRYRAAMEKLRESLGANGSGAVGVSMVTKSPSSSAAEVAHA